METLFGKTTFFVFKDHTFGYVEGGVDKRFMTLWIMAVDYMKGGDPLLLLLLVEQGEMCEARLRLVQDNKELLI